jgi:PKD repeat protein
MKKLFVFFSMMVVAAVVALNLTSCDKEPDPLPSPTVQILVDVDEADGYTVNITIQATDAATYAWDYGDGNTSVESGNHTYTYEASGDYTVSVTVDNGEGLTASASESTTIVASVEEMIAGSGDDGKTWVITQKEGSYAGKIGPGIVDNTVPVDVILLVDGVVEMFGLGSEYNDEFTFYKDGTFKINAQNDQGLAGFLYGNVLDMVITPSADILSLPLCAVPFSNVEDASWELNYDDLVVSTYNEFKDPKVFEDVTFTFPEGDTDKVAELKLSEGAYIGFADLDYPAIPQLGIDAPVDNSVYIIKEVTPDMMQISIGISGVVEYAVYPTFFLTLIFEPK